MGRNAAGRKFATLISVIFSMFMPMASSNKLPAHTISAITASARRGASALAAKLNPASYTNTHTPENGTPTPNVVAITMTMVLLLGEIDISVGSMMALSARSWVLSAMLAAISSRLRWPGF